MATITRIIAIDRVGGTAIVTPVSDTGELDYKPVDSEPSQALTVLNDPSVKNVVVDFHQTDYFGSTALGFFVKLWRRVVDRGGRLAFCNVSEPEREMLQLTTLNRLWPVFGSRAEAIRAVGE
jgi:anti-anti-sigma factor